MTGDAVDAVVIGAGPAGSATALALRARGFTVTLIERTEGDGPRPRHMGESLQGVARHALRELGIDHAFHNDWQRPCYLLRSSWAGDVLERPSIVQLDGPDLHLDRARFDAWLRGHALAAGARCHDGARITELCWHDASQRFRIVLRLGLEDGARELRARYLVDASGRSAFVSRKLRAVRRSLDRSLGVARWFREPASEPVVLVEACEHGWWYSAPLPHGELVALFVTDAANVTGRAATRAAWDAALAVGDASVA
ncbi:MAG TPA: FAD-dependent oxidoreductase, partial [Polyangiales bacterium]|nr:FAD-dependent oxidoreductase [Polyangiales bacterium]